MPLTDEQAKIIKEQILKQIESFPEDKREQIKVYVLSMDNQQLEEFVLKNKLIQGSEGKKAPYKKLGKEESQCVMCLIANKQIDSLKIYEDKDYIAVLEINPLSQGHIILVPKKHIKETKLLKANAFTIANKIGKHIIKKLNAENFHISSSDEIKHAIINIIPTYSSQEISNERKPADKKVLQELAIKIGEIKKSEKKPVIKKEKTSDNKTTEQKSEIIKLSRRIP